MSTKIKATKKNCSMLNEDSLTEDFVFRAMKSNPKEFLDNEELSLLLLFPNEKTHYIRIIHAVYSEKNNFEIVVDYPQRKNFFDRKDIFYVLNNAEKELLGGYIRDWISFTDTKSIFKNLIYTAYCLNDNQSHKNKLMAYQFISNKQLRARIRKHIDFQFDISQVFDQHYEFEFKNDSQYYTDSQETDCRSYYLFNNGKRIYKKDNPDDLIAKIESRNTSNVIQRILETAQEIQNVSYEEALEILFRKINELNVTLNRYYDENKDTDILLNSRVNYFSCFSSNHYYIMRKVLREDFISKKFWKKLVQQVNCNDRPVEDLYYYFMHGIKNKSVRYIMLQDCLRGFISDLVRLELDPQAFHDFIEMAVMEFIGIETVLKNELDINYMRHFRTCNPSKVLVKNLPRDLACKVDKFVPWYTRRELREAGIEQAVLGGIFITTSSGVASSGVASSALGNKSPRGRY